MTNDPPRICFKCDVHHVENCMKCLGFGLRMGAHGVLMPIIAAEATGGCEQWNGAWETCPMCGGNPTGIHSIN